MSHHKIVKWNARGTDWQLLCNGPKRIADEGHSFLQSQVKNFLENDTRRRFLFLWLHSMRVVQSGR